MLPTLAIVGRPNVGKSTLFNVLTKTRDALVADQPGLTRDRQIGRGQVGDKAYWLIDTGGLIDEENTIFTQITQQAFQAVAEADIVLFMVDARSGLTAADETIAQRLRQCDTPVHLVVNKIDGVDANVALVEFYQLGFEQLHSIAASQRYGINVLMDNILSCLPDVKPDKAETVDDASIKLAIVGRPNVGKSTLVNRMLGYERVIAYDEPGTTRDSIYIPFERDGQAYTLIDTAGVRRKSKVAETVEKFSVIKTLQAIENANIVLVLLDGREGMTDQDATILGSVLEAGRGLVIAMNKWDGLSQTERETVRYNLERKLHFVDFAKIYFISALHGSGVGHLFDAVLQAWRAAHKQVATSRLNQVLNDIVTAHPPPLVRGRRIKLRYIHQGGQNPPRFILHGNQLTSLPHAYQRYLTNALREAFHLQGTPITLELKQTDNPYAGRRNTLTPRQIRKRKRMMQHVKKR